MFKHILLPTDGSALSNAAVQEGIRFAKSIGAKVTGICVMPVQHPIFYEGMSSVIYSELQAEQRNTVYFMCFAAGVLIAASILLMIPKSFAMTPLAPVWLLVGFFGLHLFNRFLTSFVCEKDPALREEYSRLVLRWFPAKGVSQIKIHMDATDFFRVEYGEIVILNQTPYLILLNAKEGRFGLNDEVKY